MNEFAVIKTGGKQYRVSVGKKVKVEKIGGEAGDVVMLPEVLLHAAGGEVKIGTPHLGGIEVQAKIIRQARDKKKIIFKYHSKTRRRKKKGHRQEFTELEIVKI